MDPKLEETTSRADGESKINMTDFAYLDRGTEWELVMMIIVTNVDNNYHHNRLSSLILIIIIISTDYYDN